MNIKLPIQVWFLILVIPMLFLFGLVYKPICSFVHEKYNMDCIHGYCDNRTSEVVCQTPLEMIGDNVRG